MIVLIIDYRFLVRFYGISGSLRFKSIGFRLRLRGEEGLNYFVFLILGVLVIIDGVSFFYLIVWLS